MTTLIQNFKFALRQFRHSPGFAATVVVTLALSIGANTAIFSTVNALLLKSLPYSHPERMGTIYTRVTGPMAWEDRHHLNGEQWELLRDSVPALISAISDMRTSGVNLETASRAQYVHAGRVSEHYFDVLAINPILGRNFSATEDRPHGPKVVILSYGLWHSAFGSDANVLGQRILLKGEPYTVIGVLPQGAICPLSAELYTPIQASREGEGSGTNFVVITRLRGGSTWQEADAEINRAWLSRAERYELNDNPGAQVTYYSVPLQKGETDSLRPKVLALMLGSGLILLIACGNLAGLMLVRVLRRRYEIATRLALGASSWQIQKQLWVESLLLAVVGGLVAIAVAFVALRGLLLLLPENFLPVSDVSLDGRVLAFTAVVSLFTSVLFGILPGLGTRKFALRSALATRLALARDHLRLRQALITAEVALTVVLLASSGLLIRTLIHLQNAPPGFNPAGVMTARASLDDARYHDPAAFRKLLSESTSAMRQIPGVQQAAVGLSLPYERTLINGGLIVSDGKEAGQKITADETYITPDYFSALQIPLLAGRSFTDADGPNTQKVAVVNRTFAHNFLHDANPIGRYLNKNIEIVGVVGDVEIAPGIDAVGPLATEPIIYVPATQVERNGLSLLHAWFQPSWIVRASGRATGYTAQIQGALASVDPNLPFSGFYRMQDVLAKTLVMQRVEVALLGVLGALALLLSAVGIFALVANVIAQRTHEIGIRMALGSSVERAMVEIGRSGARASFIGLIAGLVLCAGALPVMRSVVYGIGVYDLPTVVAVVLTLTAVTAIATVIPALKIARIDPAQTLRAE